jgi:hypothetical protein
MQTIQKEGVMGLYRGMVSPMTTVPLVNAVVFSTYESAKSFLLAQRLGRSGADGVLTNGEAMLAGPSSLNTIMINSCSVYNDGRRCVGGFHQFDRRYTRGIDQVPFTSTGGSNSSFTTRERDQVQRRMGLYEKNCPHPR